MEEYFVAESGDEGEEEDEVIEEDKQEDYKFGANPQTDFNFSFQG